jgi:hypothetical protein
MKFKKLLYAIRKSIERGDFAAIEVDVALIDFLPEKIQLGIEFVFLDVDIHDRGRPSVPSFQRWRRRFNASLRSNGAFSAQIRNVFRRARSSRAPKAVVEVAGS